MAASVNNKVWPQLHTPTLQQTNCDHINKQKNVQFIWPWEIERREKKQ